MLFWLDTLTGGIRVGVRDVSTSRDPDKFAAGVYEFELELLDSTNCKGLEVFWLEELVKLGTAEGKEEFDEEEGGEGGVGGVGREGGITIWLDKF